MKKKNVEKEIQINGKQLPDFIGRYVVLVDSSWEPSPALVVSCSVEDKELIFTNVVGDDAGDKYECVYDVEGKFVVYKYKRDVIAQCNKSKRESVKKRQSIRDICSLGFFINPYSGKSLEIFQGKNYHGRPVKFKLKGKKKVWVEDSEFAEEWESAEDVMFVK